MEQFNISMRKYLKEVPGPSFIPRSGRTYAIRPSVAKKPIGC